MINFFKAQGLNIKENTVYQDNQSAIRMERNGSNSCTGNSRHIDIRYFFVKDRVDKGEVQIEYCPTGWMLADYYTKPLQGSLFRKFRDVIMGYKHINSLRSTIPAHKLKECVENIDIIKKQNVSLITDEKGVNIKPGKTNILHLSKYPATSTSDEREKIGVVLSTPQNESTNDIEMPSM